MATDNHTPRTIEIPLTKGYVAIVDEQDADLASVDWGASESRTTTYAARSTEINDVKVTYLMHRIILERMLGRSLKRHELVDHVNHIGTDNTRKNLRLADTTKNGQNSRIKRNNKLGYKGVRQRTANSFRASIRVNGKAIFLGTFRTAIEAGCAYNAAAILHFDEFAYLNEIPDWQSVQLSPLGRDHRGQTGLKGVSYYTRLNKFRAYVDVNGKRKELGYFDTAEEAVQVRLKFLTEIKDE